MPVTFLALVPLLLAAAQAEPAKPYFRIDVVDEATGRGVPLVELRTVHGVRCFSDSQGIVAFHEPGLMGRPVFFHVSSHGYEYPKDGFGFRGKALEVKAGGQARLSVRRVNVAERLYRMTGGGIYADSVLVGAAVPVKQPVLNAQVLGSDSVQNALYRGQLYWFWGDTSRPGYPLGNFHMPGAVSRLPGDGGLDPDRGVDLEYFVDGTGFARETARLPGSGPTWLDALTVLGDGKGSQRLFAAYAKIRPPMDAYERGIAEFDDTKQEFRKVKAIDLKAPLFPRGQPVRIREGGQEYVAFSHPYPLTRVRAAAGAFLDLGEYEGFTCLKEGTRPEEGQVDRSGGTVRYAWKKGTPPLGPKEQADLVKAGKLKAEEALLALRDVETGKAVMAHSGSVEWNPYRRRWGLITVEFFGTSLLGEVWYAEADTPVGPWVYARKVVSHDKYSFYNPRQHPYFAQEGGRKVYFEGTYTSSFSGNTDTTPRYDYNQVMYRLDLEDGRLRLPVAFYPHGEDLAQGPDLKAGPFPRPAFFAPDRAAPGTVAIYPVSRDGRTALTREAVPGEKPKFFALPADVPSPPVTTIPLFAHVHPDGRVMYLAGEAAPPEGFRRQERPLCRVWANPTRVELPRP